MKRPFASRRPIGPFASLDNSLTNTEFMGESLRREVGESIESIPKWAKDSSSFVEWILGNSKDTLVEMSKLTRRDSAEYTLSVCYNGEDVSFTDSVKGGDGSAPAVPCSENSIRLADIHTHPVGEQSFPSLTDVGYSDGGVSGIPTQFNTLVIRPEKTPNPIEARCSNFNLYSIQARCKANEIVSEFEDNDNVSKAQDMVRQDLIPQHGSTFELQ